MANTIAQNIADVEQRIGRACQVYFGGSEKLHQNARKFRRKNRNRRYVLHSVACGCRDFGENKVQELTEKYEILPKDIRWHMIGHLQRNKVKYLIGKVFLIHSVDSLRLAEEISKESAKKNVTTSILVEVNVAGEESKFGIRTKEEALALVEGIASLPCIRIEGLMTIAPYVENPEENRRYFQMLKQLSVDIMHKNIDNVCMDVLSMGMTGDYEVAVSEGAVYVRVGTGIFGERDYTVSV